MFWAIMLLTSFLTVIFVTVNCSKSNTGTNVSDRDDRDRDDRDDDRRSRTSCNLPTCSGSDCCDEDDKDCEDYCEDDLDLRGDDLERCYELEKDLVEELVEIFDKIDDGRSDDFEDITDSDDVELICAAVRELDEDLLKDRVDSQGEARAFLGWLGSIEDGEKIFERIRDEDDARDLLESILEEAGSGSGAAAIFDALVNQNVDLEDSDDEEPFLFFANEESRDDLIEYVHKEIIAGNEGFCDERSNWPDVDDSASSPVTNADETDQEAACILATYCAVDVGNDSGDESDEESFREDIADLLSDAEKDLIEDSKEDGGLGLRRNDAKNLTNEACEALALYWNDPTGDNAPNFGL